MLSGVEHVHIYVNQEPLPMSYYWEGTMDDGPAPVCL